MANRCLLHKYKLEDFKNWLVKNNWTIEETKGEYEVLRARSIRNRVLIAYRKLALKEHYTIADKDFPIIRDFLNNSKKD